MLQTDKEREDHIEGKMKVARIGIVRKMSKIRVRLGWVRLEMGKNS